jgi:hypothetical protein
MLPVMRQLGAEKIVDDGRARLALALAQLVQPTLQFGFKAY